jgi:hypothetical protein
MIKYRSLALTLSLSALVFAVPIWLFAKEQGYTSCKAEVLGTTLHGLKAKSKRREPWLSDRKNPIYAIDDAHADSFAIVVDSSFKVNNAAHKLESYYATYPTRTAAETAATNLKGKEITVRYDPANAEHCCSDEEVTEDAGFLSIFIGLGGFCCVGAVLSFIRSLYK